MVSLELCRTRVTTNSVNMTYAHHESPSRSVVTASDRCTEGHGFDSRRGLRFFLCPTLATC